MIDALIESFEMEMETVQNCIRELVNLGGGRTDSIKNSLETDLLAGLNQAQWLADKIKRMGGKISVGVAPIGTAKHLQPEADRINDGGYEPDEHLHTNTTRRHGHDFRNHSN